MNSRRRRRHGFTLIELLVVISIIGVLVGLLLPAIQSARATARRAQCLNNMKNIALALNSYAIRKGSYPAAGTFLEYAAADAPTADKSVLNDAQGPGGTVNPLAPPRALRSWVVDILQDLDQADLANNWTPAVNYLSTTTDDTSRTPNSVISRTALAILRCPDDTNFVPNEGNLSYVANGGFARFGANPLLWTGTASGGSTGSTVMNWGGGATQAINQRLGVMFLNSIKSDGSSPPWGGMKTTAASIVDGSGSTVLLGESTLVGYDPGATYSGGVETNWAAPFPNFCLFIGSDNMCGTSGQCATEFVTPTGQGVDSASWALANKIGTFENLGFGQNLTMKGTFPFVTSGHANGSNFAFCDGSVRFIQNTIDGTVYAKILTPAGSKLPPPFKQQPVSQDAFIQ